MSDKKKKKKKIVYYDDGRTIADMSSLYGKKADNSEQNAQNEQPKAPLGAFQFRPGHTPKDWAKTYWESVKFNLVPMFVTMGIICAAFGILYLLLLLAS